MGWGKAVHISHRTGQKDFSVWLAERSKLIFQLLEQLLQAVFKHPVVGGGIFPGVCAGKSCSSHIKRIFALPASRNSSTSAVTRSIISIPLRYDLWVSSVDSLAISLSVHIPVKTATDSGFKLPLSGPSINQ